MAIKTGLQGLKDREFSIADKKVAMTVRQGNVEFMIYSERTEAYYKIALSTDATLRLVGGSTQRENVLVGKMHLEIRDYNHIVSMKEPREALVRTLVMIKGFLEDHQRRFDAAAGICEGDAMAMFAIRNDLIRIEGFILCARE
ncbi:MAG: hypothetical protein KGH65_02605 [Candidatus Micrarchaeota archaeon]|nr:hypothetical protein [Candidatus Micrarchaeota archaeon]